MDKTKLSKIKLWDKLDSVMDKKPYSTKRRKSLYPTEASVVYTDLKTNKKRIFGSCIRKSWFRLLEFPKSNPITTKSKYTFKFGDMVEDFIRDLIKESGYFNNSSVKFFDNKTGVSGEIDVILQVKENNSTNYVFVEIKSTWGGRMVNGKEAGVAKSLFDHEVGRYPNKQKVKAQPRESNLLQLVIYLYTHKDDPNLLGGKLLYLLRDNFNRTEFDVVLGKDKTGKHRIVLNGDTIKEFYVEDIYDRYTELLSYVKESYKLLQGKDDIDKSSYDAMAKSLIEHNVLPPPRDFSLIYTEAEAKDALDMGIITSTKYNNHISRKTLCGDFQCSYCDYKDLCYNSYKK